MQLDRSHLELLSALATTSTLAAASAEINLSPSAASRRLQEANRRVGVSLVEADGRSLRLTAAGRLLADAAADSNRRLAEAELAARWLAGGVAEPFRIGVGFHDQVVWALPPSDVAHCEIIRSPTTRARDALTRRRVDAAIDVSSAGNHGGQLLCHDELVLVVAAGHQLAGTNHVTANDLQDECYLASDPNPLPGFEFERFFVPGGGGPRLIIQVETFSCALDLIARGDGISIQPRRAVEARAHAGVALASLESPVDVDWFAEATDGAAPVLAALATQSTLAAQMI